MRHIQVLEQANLLASIGCQHVIITELTGHGKKEFEVSTAPDPNGHSHRDSTTWLTSRGKFRYSADRLLRIFINKFGSDVVNHRMTAGKLISLYTTYMALYPKDEMSVNRIYYFFKRLASREFVISYCSEKKCKKPFISKNVRVRQCMTCTTLSKLRKKTDKDSNQSMQLDLPEATSAVA
ncbi:hypothetical protein [Alteromonas gilva]|uniref:Flagellar transcriptional regulator FlhC n=1 Tax=Alteromonas gilva TaxID=2987522 RepID=A0ABT5L739_9ALTE|nr:hypothetical protein [Alteromonas gilva]MDC8832859.1 hypothetical protein [Alteromonas gilva]